MSVNEARLAAHEGTQGSSTGAASAPQLQPKAAARAGEALGLQTVATNAIKKSNAKSLSVKEKYL